MKHEPKKVYIHPELSERGSITDQTMQLFSGDVEKADPIQHTGGDPI